ncbi:MAG TPA: PQQ-binding-like beta-propeller repeat protein [Planctomycetaceae bacterium]|nr:PQQ-binding-like beta-propeller repeat protein [Planctomycetaceae bacterium]
MLLAKREVPILKFIVCLALVFASFKSFAHAENWAHWRGPTGNGIAINASPPIEWSDTKNVKWKVEVPGQGLSSPIVWENRVFVTSAVPLSGDVTRGLPNLEFKVFCYDRQNGKLLWQKTATVATPHQKTHETNGFASASPCTDGEHIYAHFGSRGLFCYSMNGDFVWKRDDFGKMDTLFGFGEGSSPTLEGDMILVPWDHKGPSALYALNKRTGETIWKATRQEPTCWATPLVVEHAGHKQVVMNGQKSVRSYDLATGKELWRCGGQTLRPIASPVAINDLVIVGSGYQGAFLGAFHLDGTGDIQGTNKVVWELSHDTPDVASPLLSSGRLYFHKAKTGLLSCVDAATGKPHYFGRRIGLDNTYASPVAAGGHIYLTARSGTTAVIDDADDLKVVATNKLDETIGATPAPVDHELFIRGDKHLFCIAR